MGSSTGLAAAHIEPLIACEHCGSVYTRRELEPGEMASCQQCGSPLWRYSRLDSAGWLALTIATAIVFIIANSFPVATLRAQGLVQDATLFDAVHITWQQGHYAVACMTGLAGIGMPAAQLVLLLWVLVPLAAGRRPAGLSGLTRLLGFVTPWCMVPVFVLGVLVSIVKLADMASVTFGIGMAGFALLTILLTMLTRLSPPALWRYAEQAGVVPIYFPAEDADVTLASCHICGQVQEVELGDDEEDHHCIRCEALVHVRKPNSLARTWALILSAAILYIPANVLPVMVITTVFGSGGHTILGGVIELWQTGSWDIAMIVFIASVMVPMTKLLALSVLAWSTQRGNAQNLVPRTRLYRLVEFIGQWSMLDVFVVILLSALADFEGLMQITAGAGAAAFGMVVILTMVAAMSFDPRRAWDVLPAGAAPRVGVPLDRPAEPSAQQAG
jgi:paraquat-inducible protein A